MSTYLDSTLYPHTNNLFARKSTFSYDPSSAAYNSGLYNVGAPMQQQPMSPMGGAMGIAGAAAGLNPVLGIGTLGLGLVNTAVGLYGLSQMGKAPEYNVSGELKNSYNRAEGMAGMGLTPEEYAQAQNGITRSNNTAFQNGIDMSGGNLAGAVSAGINAQNLTATNNLAAIDAAQRRSNMQYADSLGMQVQQQKNLQTANAIDQYNKKQQAYGQAAQSGMSGLGNFANLAGLMNMKY